MDLDNMFSEFDFLNDLNSGNTNDINLTNELDDPFDLFNDTDTKSTVSQKPQNNEFGFYISLMGINPTVVIKEDFHILLDILISYGRPYEIKFLFQNLKDFSSRLNLNIINITDANKINLAQKIIKEYNEKVNKLINAFTSKTNLDFFKSESQDVNIDIPSVFQRRMKSVEAQNKKIRDIRSDIILESLIEADIKFINALTNRIDFIFCHKELLDNNPDLNKKIDEYLKRDYSYTREEIEIMEMLRFPPIYNNESFIKDKVVTSITPNTDIERDYKIISNYKSMYSKILNLKELKAEKGINLVQF